MQPRESDRIVKVERPIAGVEPVAFQHEHPLHGQLDVHLVAFDRKDEPLFVRRGRLTNRYESYELVEQPGLQTHVKKLV